MQWSLTYVIEMSFRSISIQYRTYFERFLDFLIQFNTSFERFLYFVARQQAEGSCPAAAVQSEHRGCRVVARGYRGSDWF